MVRWVPFLVALLPFFAFAQKVDMRLYTVADGMPQNSIFYIAQDDPGFLWLRHNDYISRFDGTRFYSYNNAANSIFSRKWPVNSMQASGNTLFFPLGNQITGLDLFSGAQSALADIQLPADADAAYGQCIKLPSGEVLVAWPAVKTGKIYIYRPGAGGAIGRTVLQDGILSTLSFCDVFCGDADGNLYVVAGTKNAVLKFDRNGRLLASIPTENFGESMTRLKSGANNTVLLTIHNKIYTLAPGAGNFVPHPAGALTANRRGAIFDLVETPQGDLWIGGYNRMLLHYDAGSQTVFDYSTQVDELIPNQATISMMLADGAGVVWAATPIGLLKIAPQNTFFEAYFTEKTPFCAGYCSFRGFAEDEKGGVYASFYNGIYKIEKPENGHEASLLPIENVPFDLFFYREKLLLNKGFLLDPLTGRKTELATENLPPVEGGVFGYDADGNRLWWEYNHRLYELKSDPPHWQLVADLDKIQLVSDMAFDKYSRRLWICDEKLLCSFDPADGQTRFVENPGPEKNISPKCIYPGGGGQFWLGTEKGLVLYDSQTGKQQRYTHADGLCNDIVVGILPEGDSCLWLSTFNGLSRFSIRDHKFINFFEQNGLAGNEFNRVSFFKASDERMFFGGTKGVTAFYPQKVMERYRHSRQGERLLLRSVSMTQDGSDSLLVRIFCDPRGQLDVFYENRTVSIEYGLFGAADRGQALYSYRLEGLDRNWSAPSPNTAVTFSSLPSGVYLFHLKALDARGNWLPDEIRVQFVVHPPWWNSWWAWLLYVGLAGVAVYGVFLALKKRWELKTRLQMEQKEAQRLKELDGFKSHLFTNLTHEFRTPLTVILGMAEQLSVGDPAAQASAADLIKRNARNLLLLINRMLDLSKLEDQSFKLRFGRSNVVPYLRYLVESLQSYAENQGLTLRFSSAEPELEADFDPEQLRQIMGNLLGNALKFTPKGGEIKVDLSEENSSENGRQLRIRVRDTGIGIPKAELPLVFDRFYQADSPHARTGSGTGIGLAHTQELVKLMKGRIEVESELGRGATFTVWLPVFQAHETPPRFAPGPETQPLIPDVQKTVNNTPQGVETVGGLPLLLIVEDNADVVYYLKTILADQYEIAVAGDGSSGVETALELVPDLIISDVMMPGFDGFELLKILKENELSSHIPIVLLTAKADAESRIAGFRRGADAYLPKPFDKVELSALIDMMLQNRRRQAAYFARKYAGSNVEIAPETEPEILEIFEDAFMQKVRRVVEENYGDENFSLPGLCREIGMSRYQLFRKMKALVDESPSDFIRNFRMRRANELLKTTSHSIKEVAYMVGYKDIPHFSRTYQEVFGMPPSATSR